MYFLIVLTLPLVLYLIGFFTLAFTPQPLLRWIQQKSGVLFLIPSGNKPVCAITIDDAPSLGTNEILDVLKKHKTKATFFCIKQNIEQCPDVFQRIVSEGHQIGNHDVSVYISSLKSSDRLERDLKSCNESILKNGATVPKYVRFASGIFFPHSLKVAQKLNLQVVLGDSYPHDCHFPFLWCMVFYLRSLVKNGSIIILHDGSSQRAHRCASALDNFIGYWKSLDREIILV